LSGFWALGSGFLLAALSGLLLTLAQPPVGWAPLAWIALWPLLLAIDGKPWGQRLLLGGVAGMVWSWSLVGYWLLPAFHEVPLPLVTAALLTQLTIAISGVLGVVAFAYLCGDWRRTRLSVVSVPAIWVAIEYARANVTGGSPWCLLGHSQYAYPAVIQIADVTGVYGVSFLLCSATMWLASWSLASSTRRSNLIVASLLMLLSLGYGAVRLRQRDAAPDTVAIQAVHPAWPRGLGEAAEQRLADLIRLSEQAAPDPSALLVWPENALRFHLQEESALRDQLTAFIQGRRQYTVAGVHRYDRDQGTTRYFNSVVLIAAEGSVVGVADKRLLVPVAESRWSLLPSVEQPFTAGKPWVPLSLGQRQIGVLVCFESIFPEPARMLVRQGASVLVNPTNDEILGDGATQLAAMAVFRSVENHVPLVHVGTAGVTQIVDARGRIVATENRDPRALTATVSADHEGTWYTQMGDVFALVCCAWLFLSVTYRLLAAR